MLEAIGLEILIIFVLLLANGVFSGSEIAIVSARRSRLQQEAETGSRAARQALNLSQDPDRFLATVQIGITLIGTLAAALGGASIGDVLASWFSATPSLAPYAETLALTIVVVAITYFSLVIGELVPKRLALQHAERIAVAVAPLMNALAWITRPLVAVLTGSVSLVLRLLGQRRTLGTPVTQEDILYMASEGATGGTVEAGEAQLIRRVFEFSDRSVRSAMTPRTEIVALDIALPLADMVSRFIESGYSRLPVYEGSTDHIVGILSCNDLLRAVTAGDHPAIAALLRPPAYVPEQQHIDDVLALFRQKGTHFAIVIDEFGTVAGLVTLQDILEELVGEMPEEQAPGDRAFVQREDGSWLVDAMEPYDRVLERVGMPPLPAGEQPEFSSLAGLILARLGRIPSVGDNLEVDGHILEIVDMDGQRIDRVLIRTAGEQHSG